MADEPRYSDELRIPISITLPWSGRLTKTGKPWPKDRSGRDWPKGRTGNPVFPIHELPKGFAPGTSDIYKQASPETARSVTEHFAAIDAAMWAEMRLARARVRLVADRRPGPETARPPDTKLPQPILSDQEAFDRGLASSPRPDAIRIPQDANSHLHGVPLVDSSGNPIRDATGKIAHTPEAFSAEFFYQRGREDAHLYDRAIETWRSLKPLGEITPDHQLTFEELLEATAGRFSLEAMMKLQHLPISRFGQQAPWDAQRYHSPKVIDEFRSAASICIGIYAAAAGIPRDMIQDIQNDYAALYSDFEGQKTNETYHHLADVNVKNVDIGYDLVSDRKVE